MIPACIGNATSLGELDLSSNALSRSILSGIGTGLVNLYLQNNQLSGEIPANRLAECIRLLHLDLSNNSLTGEPRRYRTWSLAPTLYL